MEQDNHIKLYRTINKAKDDLEYYGICHDCGCLLQVNTYCGNPQCVHWAAEDTPPGDLEAGLW